MTKQPTFNSILWSVIFLITCFTVPAAAVELPAGTLGAEQVEKLFSGNTVAAENVEGTAQELVAYFRLDGKLQQARKGWLRNGEWKVRKDGRLCITLEGSKRDCRIIVPQGDVFLQYAVKLDGNHRHELTYTEFRPGQKLAQMSTLPILPAGTLKKKAVIKLFEDQTVESVTARKGRVSQTYYSADGNLEQFRQGTKRYGKWRVTKNGRICLQMEDLREKCRIIVEEGGEYKKYIVKKNGKHQHSVSYRKFTPGKAFD